MVLREGSPPRGTFKGQNFMTPNIRAYYKLRMGEGWAELSDGTGIRQEPIFGVTVRQIDGEDGNKRSQLFHSKSAAIEYIESLS